MNGWRLIELSWRSANVDGFINLNKPAGWTSHDCVAKVRRLLKQKKVGHAGTLDPAAVGVLPIAVGRATRLLQFLRGDKAYRAVIRFGIRTTTDDLEGERLEDKDASFLTEADILQHLPKFQGVIQQIPPSYSAIQVDGQRLYDLARQGKDVDVPMRTVNVYEIVPLAWHPGKHPDLEVTIACGSGTYIRAIARDWGDQVGTGATLAFLERIDSSGFPLATSLTLDQLAEQLQHQTFQPIPPEMILKHLPRIDLDEAIARRWRMGQKIPLLSPTIQWGSASQSANVSHVQPTIVTVFEGGDTGNDQSNQRFLGIGEWYATANSLDQEVSDLKNAADSSIDSSMAEQAQHQETAEGLLRPRMVFVPV
jgi:tRNA pseudouridine55 synthase